MSLLKGISYNFRGLLLGLKTPSLLALGITRLIIILVFTLLAIGIVLSQYQQIADLIWSKPESYWLIWLWYIVTWIMVLLVAAIAGLFSFLVAQLLFILVMMDYMSRITERKVTGKVAGPPKMSFFSQFVCLLKQEVPRAIIPILLSMLIMLIGWFTPLSPITTVLSPLMAATFLAWDNTDLVPARRLKNFEERFKFFRGHLIFHVGFGLCFLVPLLNIVLLSFAPVGATLYYVEEIDGATEEKKEETDNPKEV